MQIEPLPPDADLETISLALFPSVLDRIESRHRTSRRVRWSALALCGACLLVSGALIGAADLAPVFNPGNGKFYENGKFEPATFAINCYSSTASNAPGLTQQYSSQKDINKAISNFGAACDSLDYSVAYSGAVGQAAFQQHAAGYACGVIKVNGGQTARWVAAPKGSPPALSFTTGPPNDSSKQTGCGPVKLITVPHTSMGRVAACAIASNWVAVYPAGGASSSTICRRKGLPVWEN
jgi:hypothetical protein